MLNPSGAYNDHNSDTKPPSDIAFIQRCNHKVTISIPSKTASRPASTLLTNDLQADCPEYPHREETSTLPACGNFDTKSAHRSTDHQRRRRVSHQSQNGLARFLRARFYMTIFDCTSSQWYPVVIGRGGSPRSTSTLISRSTSSSSMIIAGSRGVVLGGGGTGEGCFWGSRRRIQHRSPHKRVSIRWERM